MRKVMKMRRGRRMRRSLENRRQGLEELDKGEIVMDIE